MKQTLKNKTFEVTFRVSNVCNLDCLYCHWNKLVNYKTNDILNSIENIFKLTDIKDIDELVIYFHGGEPSFHPDILIILDKINELKQNYKFKTIIDFQTNLSLDTNLYVEIEKRIDQLSVTLHYKYLNEKNLLQKFVKNINTVGDLYSFDIMLEHIHITEMAKFQRLVKILLMSKTYEISEMIYSFCHYDYDTELQTMHKKFYDDYSVTKNEYFWPGTVMEKPMTTNEMFRGVDFTASMCNAGNNFLIVEGDGETFRCGSHMTNYIKEVEGKPVENCGTSKSLGNINIDPIEKFNMKDSMCEWKFCGGDFYVEKYPKDGSET